MSAPRPKRTWQQSVLIVVSAVLPAVGLGAELSLRMFRDMVGIDLFPSPTHTAAALAAVMLNLALHGMPRGEHLTFRSLALGFVTGTALAFALGEAQAAAEILVAVFMGLGLLALAPVWVLLGALPLWTAHVRAWRAAAQPLGRLLLLVLPSLLLVPSWLAVARYERTRTERAMHAVATSSDAAEVRQGLAWLRAADPALQEALCRPRHADDSGRAERPMDWYLARLFQASPLDPEQARAVFHRAHGRGVFDAMRDADDPQFLVSDSDLVVAVERDAALARVEWTIELTNRSPFSAEATLEFGLPEGAVASGLSLWIDGTERPAAFGDVAQATKAYTSVVRSARDPALLAETAPGRVRLNVFPVPGQGSWRTTRVMFTLPLHLRADAAWLELPKLYAPGWSTKRLLHTTVITDGERRVERKVADDALASVHVSFARGADAARCIDVDGIVRQELDPVPAAPPESLVLAIDGSASALRGAAGRGKLLDALPKGMPCTVLVAQDLGYVQRSGASDDPGLRGWLEQCEFAGGVDSAPMLATALAAVGDRPGTLLLWLHGEQALAHSATEPVRAAAERCSAPFLALALAPGPHVVLDAIGERVRRAPRTEDLAADLRWVTARGAALDVAERRFSRLPADAPRPPAETKVGDQLARLWAANEARARWSGGKHGEATAIARRYRLVTAGSAAVVLESAEQYQRAGLDPGAPAGTFEPVESLAGSPVPEPATWILLVSAAFAVVLRRRLLAG